MFSRFQMIFLGAIAIAVLGISVAAAGDYGSPGSGSKAQSKKGKSKKGKTSKQYRAFQKLEASRVSRSAYLTGAAEVDAQGEDDAGDPDAKGAASLLQADERTICYGFSVFGAGTPTKVHIHKGGPGKNGPPVIEFANVPKNANGVAAGDPGASSGCKVVTAAGELAALRRIRKKPNNYYLNIHTDAFPDGAVRGQLAPMWFDNDGKR